MPIAITTLTALVNTYKATLPKSHGLPMVSNSHSRFSTNGVLF